MTHIATYYTQKEGRKHPNLIRFFWDQETLTLYRRDIYLIDEIYYPEKVLPQDPDTKVWCKKEALEFIQREYFRDDGTLWVAY